MTESSRTDRFVFCHQKRTRFTPMSESCPNYFIVRNMKFNTMYVLVDQRYSHHFPLVLLFDVFFRLKTETRYFKDTIFSESDCRGVQFRRKRLCVWSIMFFGHRTKLELILSTAAKTTILQRFGNAWENLEGVLKRMNGNNICKLSKNYWQLKTTVKVSSLLKEKLCRKTRCPTRKQELCQIRTIAVGRELSDHLVTSDQLWKSRYKEKKPVTLEVINHHSRIRYPTNV